MRAAMASLVCALALTLAVFAQAGHPSHELPVVPGELLNRPLPLGEGIGRAHDAADTGSADAQAFYDQGLAYLHGYVWIEAARSFHQALRLDSNLALAYVGLSYAYEEVNQSAAARDALDRARALAERVNEHDRRHILIRGRQLEAEAAPGDTAKL